MIILVVVVVRSDSFFSGIYWRAISYFRDFGFPLVRLKKFAITYFTRFPSEKRNNINNGNVFLLAVKCFHDEIELRVKLNLPSGHSTAGLFSFLSRSLWSRLAEQDFMKTPSHIAKRPSFPILASQ